MKLTEALKKEIEEDINRCKQHTTREYNYLLAKYIVIDPEFEKGLSIMGKTTFSGQEFDYRPELNAIANKLHMWLILYDNEKNPNPIQVRVQKLLEEGLQIGKDEYHKAENGFPFSYVAGTKYDAWMAEINIINERY